MNDSGLEFLLDQGGLAAASELADWTLRPADQLQDLERLRARFGSEGGRALYDLELLRRRARIKFRLADAMIFERGGLEQATSEPVARLRAARFQEIGVRSITDLGCGLGGDALALAADHEVLGIENVPLRARLAEFNVRVYEPEAEFRVEERDLEAWSDIETDALFFDPARRDSGGRRAQSPTEYHPPLSCLDRWLPRVRAAAAKVAPSVRAHELPPDTEVDWVSLEGELKEATLWFGDARRGIARRAVILPGEHVLEPSSDAVESIGAIGAVLLDPDPAVIQAGLVESLAQHLGARRIDWTVPHLTADQRVDSPFARSYRVTEVVERPLRQLRRRLKERRLGRITLASRGVTIDLEKLRPKLRVPGEESAHVIFTKRDGESVAVICVAPGSAS